jgi:DNA-binding IclR family transcriptional regulator
MAGGGDGVGRRSVAEKLFAIADAFQGGRELTLAQVTAATGLPRSTAHRLLAEWVRWGGLTRGDDGIYRVGLRLWRLGVRESSSRALRSVARPYLLDLLEATGEHVHLAVLDRLGATYLERLSASDAVATISEVGTELPLHATGVGNVLLAFAPVELLAEVLEAGPEKFMPNTLTTERALRARLAEVRATDLARTTEELTPGSYSVAAPVRDRGGSVVAAVSIITHVDRRDEPQLVLGVRMTARAISAALGWRR